jgi:hypothetical protein
MDTRTDLILAADIVALAYLLVVAISALSIRRELKFPGGHWFHQNKWHILIPAIIIVFFAFSTASDYVPEFSNLGQRLTTMQKLLDIVQTTGQCIVLLIFPVSVIATILFGIIRVSVSSNQEDVQTVNQSLKFFSGMMVVGFVLIVLFGMLLLPDTHM